MAIHLLSEKFVATVTSNRMYNDGGGLALRVQRDGRAKSWVFTYNGTPYGEQASQRITIGSALKISLEDARHKAAAYRALISRKVSPGKYIQTEAAQRAAGHATADITWQEAVEEFYRHGCENLWNTKHSRNLPALIKRNYLLPAVPDSSGRPLGPSVLPIEFNKLPLREFKITHLETILSVKAVNGPRWRGASGPTWRARPEMANRIRSYVHSMIERAIIKGLHPGPNPAAWGDDHNGPLDILMGRQPEGGHHQPLRIDEVPALMAELRKPLHDKNVMTMFEATQATGRSAESIRLAIKKGLISGAHYKNPKDPTIGYLIPAKALAKLYPLVRKPEQLPDEQLYSWVLQYIILTLVRSGMACELRWDHIHENDKVIVYPRDDHKGGHDNNRTYVVPITPAVAELITTMKARRDREDIKSEYVFARAPSRFGVGVLSNTPPNPHTIDRNLKRAFAGVDCIKTKDATVHGFRATFGEWACEERGYDRVMVHVALGHSVAGVMSQLGISGDVDKAYLHKVKYKNRRREMMEEWEKYCLSACGEPGVLLPFRKKKEA